MFASIDLVFEAVFDDNFLLVSFLHDAALPAVQTTFIVLLFIQLFQFWKVVGIQILIEATAEVFPELGMSLLSRLAI